MVNNPDDRTKDAIWPVTTAIDRNPLHAEFYADRACQARVRIIENVRLARDTYRVRFDCPEIARRFVPGQFLMLRLAGLNDPLLGRPLALYDTVLDAAGAPIGHRRRLRHVRQDDAPLALSKPGDELDVWGPLGNGFPPIATDHLIMVAGGIGQTPFLALGQEYLGLRQYGDPPRTRAARQARHALLRRAHRRSASPASPIFSRPASTCASAATTAPSAITAS